MGTSLRALSRSIKRPGSQWTSVTNFLVVLEEGSSELSSPKPIQESVSSFSIQTGTGIRMATFKFNPDAKTFIPRTQPLNPRTQPLPLNPRTQPFIPSTQPFIPRTEPSNANLSERDLTDKNDRSINNKRFKSSTSSGSSSPPLTNLSQKAITYTSRRFLDVFPDRVTPPPFKLAFSSGSGVPTKPTYNTDETPLRLAYKVWGIDVDRFTGKIYVTDKVWDQVRVFSPHGVQLAEFGRNILHQPAGVAVDHGNKRVIVSSKMSNQISMFSLEGEYIYSFGRTGSRLGQFNYPWGVAVSPAGDRIVVADSMNHRLQSFDKYGNYLSHYSAIDVNPFRYKVEFDYPRGITFDEQGKNIYAADFNIEAVFKFNLDFTEKTTVVPHGRLNRPQGITVNESGNILVCDSGRDIVRVVSPTGHLLANIRGDGEYKSSPQDLSILPSGQVVIIDDKGMIRVY